ncbi:MAG TPA: hypothetical protein VMV08_06305 [Gaiellaceae bacterium]|nr:hypothetical protein [Gaiellaceae bacterium]
MSAVCRNDRLAPVALHRVLVVGHVVEVDRARRPILTRAGDEGAGAGLAAHPLAQGGRIGEHGRDQVARRDFDPADSQLLGRVEPVLVQCLQDVDELVAEPVIEGDAAAVDPPRDEHNLLVLDVHAFDHADPSGNSKSSGSLNGSVV